MSSSSGSSCASRSVRRLVISDKPVNLPGCKCHCYEACFVLFSDSVVLLTPPQAVATVNNTVVAPSATIMLQTVQIPPCTTVMGHIKYNCCIVVGPAVSFLYFSTIKLCLTLSALGQ